MHATDQLRSPNFNLHILNSNICDEDEVVGKNIEDLPDPINIHLYSVMKRLDSSGVNVERVDFDLAIIGSEEEKLLFGVFR